MAKGKVQKYKILQVNDKKKINFLSKSKKGLQKSNFQKYFIENLSKSQFNMKKLLFNYGID